MSNFYLYFRQNMDSLGLPAPESMFGNLQTALANAAAFIAHVDKSGQRVTVKELIGAGLRAKKLGMVATLTGAFHVGAVIGSIAVATGRTLSGESQWQTSCGTFDPMAYTGRG